MHVDGLGWNCSATVRALAGFVSLACVDVVCCFLLAGALPCCAASRATAMDVGAVVPVRPVSATTLEAGRRSTALVGFRAAGPVTNCVRGRQEQLVTAFHYTLNIM